jgi:RHH-type rel operon transcriptional repressor/antitoxin RelB
MHTISFQIDDGLHKQLELFSRVQDRSKAYILRKAVESYLEDQEDIKIGLEALDEFYKTGSKTYSLDEIKKENGL